MPNGQKLFVPTIGCMVPTAMTRVKIKSNDSEQEKGAEMLCRVKYDCTCAFNVQLFPDVLNDRC